MGRWKWLDEFGGVVAFLVVLAAGAIAVWLLLSEGLQPADRAYIQFRHARNLAVEGRLSFTVAGKPVLATEAPAFVALLAAGSVLVRTSRIDHFALVLNAFFIFWLVVISYLIAKNLFRSVLPAVLAAILMSFHSSVVAIFAQGFEQAMLLSVSLSSFYLLSKRRLKVGLVLASLTPLIALEGVIVLVVALLFLLLRHRRLTYFTLALAAPLSWIAFSWHYYGTAIPQSLSARHEWHLLSYPYQPVWYNWSDWILGCLYSAARGCVVLHRVLFSGGFSETHFGGAAYARLLLALSLAVYWIWSSRKIAKIFIFPILFLLLSPILRTESRSMISCVTLVILFYYLACCLAWRNVVTSKDRYSRKFLELAGYLTLFILFQMGSRYEMNPWGDPILTAVDPRGSRWLASDRQRHNSYRRASEYLKKRAATDKTVLVSEPGFFGYVYAGEIFDGSGYCTPLARRFYPPQPSDLYDQAGWRFTRAGVVIPSLMIDAVRADYIVAPEAALKHVLQSDFVLLRDYDHLTRAGLVWGSWLSIYERKASQ